MSCNSSSVIYRHGSTSSSIIRTEHAYLPGKCEKYFSALSNWVLWRAILLGQVLSLLICTTAIITQVLTSKFGIGAPTAQNFLVYILMCLTFTTVLACRTGDDGLLQVLKDRWWRYLLVAILDVEANYLVVKAYQYTTLTSIQLLDCFTIPVVLLLSWVVMRVRYKIIHIVGVSVSLMGIGCLVWADADSSRDTDKAVEHRLTGDMVCMAGAFFYGVTNIAEEHFIKKYDQIEFLGMLGLFGSVLSGLQLAVIEHPQVSNMNWHHWEEVGLVVLYSVTLFVFYALVPLVITTLGSTALNLSLLSADYFSLIAGVAMFQYKYHALYALSFVFVITGVVVFSAKKTSKHNDDQELRGTYSFVSFVVCWNFACHYDKQAP